MSSTETKRKTGVIVAIMQVHEPTAAHMLLVNHQTFDEIIERANKHLKN